MASGQLLPADHRAIIVWSRDAHPTGCRSTRFVSRYQIRLQLRGDLYGVNNKWIAGQLKLTDEVKKKAAELDKATQEKIFEAYSTLRDLQDEERRKKYGEIREKIGKIRAEANEKALGILNDEQKEQYAKFKGKEFKIGD